MKFFHFKYLVFVFFLSPVSLFSQTDKKEFKAVDEYVKSLGSLDSMNMGSISYTLTKRFPESLDKVRAIFDWVALNINFDCKSARNGNNTKTYYAEDILKTRKATSSGYASLFQDLCSVAKIRCLTVDGYVKNEVEQINEKPDEFNHTWAVVQLGQSPESWFYVDPTRGSGYTDDKITTFTKAFNDQYFFSDKRIFNMQHYPDNTAWMLNAGPRSLNEFLSFPLVKDAAFEFGLIRFLPANGYIKTKTTKPVQFTINIDPSSKVDIVALSVGNEKKKKSKTVDYTYSNGVINFTFKFEEEDAYPVAVLINGKDVLKYFVESTE